MGNGYFATRGAALSGVVHTWVLARANRDRAMEFFQQALKSDVSDIQGGTTSEGIHLAAMAGSVDLMQRCFTGLETRGDRIVLSPDDRPLSTDPPVQVQTAVVDRECQHAKCFRPVRALIHATLPESMWNAVVESLS